MAYGVQAMPAYLLIGEDGTILSPRAKRPSSRTVAAELNQAFDRVARYQSFVLPPLPAPAKLAPPAALPGPVARLRP